MGKRTIENGYFGSVGMSDPMSSFAERTLRIAWDFSKKNVPENKVIPLIQIPKGFCIDRISLVQTAATDQDVSLTFGLESDDSFTVGGSFALKDLTGETALCRSSQAAKQTTGYVASSSAGSPTSALTVGEPLFVDDADVLCMIVPDGLTGVHGFEVFSEGVASNALNRETFRDKLQTTPNVSGGQYPLE